MAAIEVNDEEGGDFGAEAQRRASVLRPLVQAYLSRAGSLESGIGDAVWELGVSRTTVWRWIRRLAAEGGRTSALVPRKRGRRNGSVMVPGDVEGIIEEHLTRYYLRRERPSLARVVTEIRSACLERGLQPPTRRTVQRRLDAMDAREVMKAREGAKAARQRFAPVTGRNRSERPLDVVEIDHTPADIILVDSFERKPIGRPWVTLAIDIATRMVTGYHVSFDAPSRLSVALCLTRAVAPKAEFLADLECNAPWPAQGKPVSIHVDNGRDFRSQAFQSACAEWGINLVYRPPGSPHFGGHVERLIGTMMGAVPLEYQSDHLLQPDVGIKAKPDVAMPDIAHRHADPQFTTARLRPGGVDHSRSDHTEFELADAALHPQQKPVVRSAGIVDTVEIYYARFDQATKFEQVMPVPAVAGQPRGVETQHRANLACA